MNKLVRALVAGLFVTAGIGAQADTLFASGFDPLAFPDHTEGYFSETDNAAIADRFVLSQSGSIEQIRAWGFFLYTAPVRYRIEILPEINAVDPLTGLSSVRPASTPILTFESSDFASVVASGYTHASNVPINILTFTLGAPLELPAGNYWLSVAETAPSNTVFAWNRANAPADWPNIAYQLSGSADWHTTTVDSHLAFQLIGTAVPEPETTGMLLLGLAAIALRGRQAKRQAMSSASSPRP